MRPIKNSALIAPGDADIAALTIAAMVVYEGIVYVNFTSNIHFATNTRFGELEQSRERKARGMANGFEKMAGIQSRRASAGRRDQGASRAALA